MQIDVYFYFTLLVSSEHVADTDGISATPKAVTPKLRASKLLLSTASVRVHRSH